ncbi:MAG: hypothetical protein QXX20_05565 [Candidatus Thermoplasmatota archaeon]
MNDQLTIPTQQELLYQKRDIKPVLAGIFLILAAVFGFVLWTIPFTLDDTAFESMINITQIKEMYPEITFEQLKSSVMMCSVIQYILCVVTLLGGILAFKKKVWYIAILGSICGIFTVGTPPAFVSTMLSILALILLLLSRKEFQGTAPQEKI